MDKIKGGIGNLEWPQKEAKNYNEWMQYIHKEITRQCECTSPQPANGLRWCEDNMCICGNPTIEKGLIAQTAEEYWTNDSGYSDVFHNDYE